MRIRPEDVHALTIIAMDPSGQLADRLMAKLPPNIRNVGRGLRGEVSMRRMNPSVRSAVKQFQHWAKRKSPGLQAA